MGSPSLAPLSMHRAHSKKSAQPAAKSRQLVNLFDTLVARMNTPKAKRGLDALFKASPEALGEAAVRAARRGEV